MLNWSVAPMVYHVGLSLCWVFTAALLSILVKFIFAAGMAWKRPLLLNLTLYHLLPILLLTRACYWWRNLTQCSHIYSNAEFQKNLLSDLYWNRTPRSLTRPFQLLYFFNVENRRGNNMANTGRNSVQGSQERGSLCAKNIFHIFSALQKWEISLTLLFSYSAF